MKFTIFILFTLFSIDIFAQPKDINVDGKVFGEDEAPLKNVLIEVYKNDSSYYKYRTEEKGEYHFNLPYNFNYTIVFSKNKYYSKIIDIKAEGITREDLSFAQKKIGEWQVFLFREVPGVDASIFDDAVGEIFFNEKTGLIDWNADYFESKRQDLIDFEGLSPQMLVALGKDDVKSLEDFATCADWELAGGYTTVNGERHKDDGVLESFEVNIQEAQDMIMRARLQIGWVTEEQLAEDAAAAEAANAEPGKEGAEA